MADFSLEDLVSLENRISGIGRTLSAAESEQDISEIVSSTVALYRDIRDNGCYSYACETGCQEGGRLGPQPEEVRRRIAGITDGFGSLLSDVAARAKGAARIVSDSLSQADGEEPRRKLLRLCSIYDRLQAGIVQPHEDRFTHLFDEEIDSCVRFNSSLLSLIRRYESIVSSYLCSDITASVVSEKSSEVGSLLREVKALPKGFGRRGAFDHAYDVGAWVDRIKLFRKELRHLGKPKRLERVVSQRRLVDVHMRYYAALADDLNATKAHSSDSFLTRLAGLHVQDPLDFSSFEDALYLSARRQGYESARQEAVSLIGRKRAEAKEILMGEFSSFGRFSPLSGDAAKDLQYFRQKLAEFQGFRRRYCILFDEPDSFSGVEQTLSSMVAEAEAAVAVERGCIDRASQREHEERMAKLSADRDVEIKRIEAERDVGVAMCVSSDRAHEAEERLETLSGLYDSLKEKVDAMSSRWCGYYRRDRPSYKEITKFVCS